MIAAPKERTIYNPIQKDKVTFIKTATETNYQYTLIRVELAPLGEVGLHYHKTYTEKFSVIQGELGITLGNTDILLNKGEAATADRDILHRFYNPSKTETVIFETEIRPASAGFERSLQILYGLARDGKTNQRGIPKNILHLALLLELGESKLPGKYSVFEFILLQIAKVARWLKVDRDLKKYYLSM
jgi:mannose-6-phosphate isomerase-like protein (cupin superfamily)